ncbi:hypothetical protein BSKO_10782 [Bryopsis sp. KO-2023]|nr:hypothetical protein BSKO_10782 [Bryopsis sp. KO-2023]
MSSDRGTCPAWEHLRIKESDDEATMRSKFKQLRTLSEALRQTVTAAKAEEETQDSVCDSHDEDEQSGLMLHLALPVQSAKLSNSARYLCGVLQCCTDLTDKTAVQIMLWELQGSFANPPITFGTRGARFDPAKSETSIRNAWDIMETSQGPLVVMSGGFRMELDKQEAIRCFLPESQTLHCVHKLKLKDRLHSIATTGNTIIAAGADGKGIVWNGIGSEKEPHSKQLPQAKYKWFPFDWITELRLSQGKEEWVVGLSSQGSIVLWDHQRLQILTTVHDPTFLVSDLHVLPADACSEGPTFRETPLAFLGCIVERDNPNSQRNVAGMLLRNGLFNVGSAFPLEGVEKLWGNHDFALASMQTGEVVAWDISQGKPIWWSDEFKGKEVTGIWMGSSNIVIVMTYCGIIFVRKLRSLDPLNVLI